MLPLSPSPSLPTYIYEGRCPRTGDPLRLPRTALAEAIAGDLMAELSDEFPAGLEGKMYGVLLVVDAEGKPGVLKAFSGLWRGQSCWPGWVPPIPGRELVRLEETHTLEQLEAIKQRLLVLQQLPERDQLVALQQRYSDQLATLKAVHRQRKQERQRQRRAYEGQLVGEDLAIALEVLKRQSQLDGMAQRRLKRQRDADLQPLQTVVAAADEEMRSLRQQRRILSRQLQAQMHGAYRLSNFAGESLSIDQLTAAGALPTGTGDCCAPKLLHYAAIHQLQPLALAEFWWGTPSSNGDRQSGQFYGACSDRCQPIMGFLLSGLSDSLPEPVPAVPTIEIIYIDDWLIAVNKPAGLLSVPGRSITRQESALNQLRQQFPKNPELIPVHRLDQATSGIMLFARDRYTHRAISRQFQQRQVHKVYEAILDGALDSEAGEIHLPLWGDPHQRPRQGVDEQRGKSSHTKFRVMARSEITTRVEFMPITGRTHQLRVHAAHPDGLGTPILGDTLYGSGLTGDHVSRLMLHARQLTLSHPYNGDSLALVVPTPF